MKPTLTILFYLLLSNCLFAQMPFSIQWQKYYGGLGLDQGYSIKQTSDGGYIVAGISRSSDGDISGHIGDVDGWVLKLNQSGAIEWERSLGSPYDDYVSCIQQTSDDGYIIAGGSNSLSGSIAGKSDFYIVKLKNHGDIEWQKFLGGSGIDRAFSIEQTNEGGYIVAGESNSHDGDVTGNHGSADMWIVKLDVIGNLMWQKSIGGSGQDGALCIKQTNDGGYIAAGSSSSTDGDVISGWPHQIPWIVRLTNKGEIVWQKEYGTRSATTTIQQFNSVQQTKDGGYIVAGSCDMNGGDVTDNHGSNDFWIIKIDANGNANWKKSFGGSQDENANEIQQTPDGEYIAVGTTNSHDGDVDDNNIPTNTTLWWVVEITSSGTLKWKKSFGNKDHGSGANSVQKTTDGGFIIAGIGGVESNAYHDNWDIGVLKLIPNSRGITSLNIYPNPASDYLKVKFISQEDSKGLISVFDFIGREIYRKDILLQVGLNSFEVNTSAMASGGYILVITTEVQHVGRFIKLPN